jgi:uncharacterized protein with NRDE domain
VTKKLSLLHAGDWLKLFSKHKTIEGYNILVGNKIDIQYRYISFKIDKFRKMRDKRWPKN